MSMISVIIPVYNVEKYLDICLDSVILQTFRDFEVICINDGSTDKSGEIAQKYADLDKRIRVVHTENRGLSAARNTGLKKASGKYVTFIDSDDSVSQIFLERMYTNIEKYKSDYSFCNILCENETTGESYFWELYERGQFKNDIKEPLFCENNLAANVYPKMFPMAYAKLYKRDFIEDLRFPEGLIFEDTPFFTECYLKAKKISYDLDNMYFYRIARKDSIISSAQNKYKDLFKIFELTKTVFEKYSKWDKYKNIFLLQQMENIFNRTMSLQEPFKKEMFVLLQEHFKKIDFSDYDQTFLTESPVYRFYRNILLNVTYEEFCSLAANKRN